MEVEDKSKVESVMVVITSNDEVKTMPYVNYESQREVIEGFIELFGSAEIFVPFEQNLKVDFWCNEEYRYCEAESCKKVNPVGSALYGGLLNGLDIDMALSDEQGLIFGNVAITVSLPEGETRGFENIIDEKGEQDICEAWIVEDILLRVKNGMEAEGIIQTLHENYDNKPVEPKTHYVAFNDPEEFFKAIHTFGKDDVKVNPLQPKKNKGNDNTN